MRSPTVRRCLPAVAKAALPAAVFTAVSVVATWPLARQGWSKLAGDVLDPWQTLWGFWWLRHSLDTAVNPMFCRLLWWPSGTPLWFQSWDVPAAMTILPIWNLLPHVALYNLVLFVSFPASGLTFYLLGKELWGGRLAALLAGCLYTFSAYHFAHARMQLHLASMQWSPMYFLGLFRIVRLHRARDAVLAGVGLSLATASSIYHLVFCAVGTLVLAICEIGAGRLLVTRVMVRRFGLAAGVCVLLVGWLLSGMVLSYLAEPYVGRHDAVRFSVDLESFFVPNAVSIWSSWLSASSHWTGNEFESVSYPGYVVLGLALLGARRAALAKRFILIAVVGGVLALGPQLHVGGLVYSGLALPEAWMEYLVPPLRLSGLPARFAWLTTFGLATAAGAGLASLCKRGRFGIAAAVGLATMALVELWPRPFPMSEWPNPSIFQEWAADTREWAVLDATAWSRALWHQMAHHHPIIAGYATRVPERQWLEVQTNDTLRQFFRPPLGANSPSHLSAERGREALTALSVRFVIVEEDRTDAPGQLLLRERYRGDGLVIFEVPGVWRESRDRDPTKVTCCGS